MNRLTHSPVRTLTVLACVAGVTVSVSQANAATYNYATGTTWASGTTWTTLPVDDANYPSQWGDNANFGSAVASNIAMAMPTSTFLSVGQINLNDDNNVTLNSATSGYVIFNNGASASSIDVQGGGTLQINTLMALQSGGATPVKGGTLTKTGAGTLIFNNQTNRVTNTTINGVLYGGTNESLFQGTLNINEGALQVNDPGALGSAGGGATNTNFTVAIAAGTMLDMRAANLQGGLNWTTNNVSGTLRLTDNGSGNMLVGANNDATVLNVNSASATIDARTTNASTTQQVTLYGKISGSVNNVLTLDLRNASNTGFAYFRYDRGAVANDFAGTTVVYGHDTLTGRRDIVSMKNNNVIAVAGNLTLNNANWWYGDANQTDRNQAIADSATVTLNGVSTLNLRGRSGGGGATDNITKLILNNTSALTFNADNNSRLIVGSGTPTASTANRGFHLTTGGSLIVNNTFDPSYNVNGLAASSGRNLAVVTGATLGGSGTIGSTNFGSVTIDGTVGPGNSAGTLNLGVTTTLNGIYSYEAGDLLAITGTLTLGGSSQLSLVGSLTDPLYTIATFSNTPSGTFGTVDPTILASYTVNYNDGSITLTAIPEPGTLALAGLGATMMFWRSRRRTM